MKSFGKMFVKRIASKQTAFKMSQQTAYRPVKRLVSSPRRTDRYERNRLYEKYAGKISVNPDLARQIVSFQANKKEPFYRWLKFKEAFSSQLVKYCIDRFKRTKGGVPRILDPFAGAGTTLTTAARSGWEATGIELLPVGIAAARARLEADVVDLRSFEHQLAHFQKWTREPKKGSYTFTHLRITKGAFPKETEDAISSFLLYKDQIEDAGIRDLFGFACLSVLEDVSYTRKDGQYLRWDSRSPRKLKSSFHKGLILPFWTAVSEKLELMLEDIRWRNGGRLASKVNIIEGSCLDVLPTISNNSFDLVLTSPPYCNRYDYTRTYALELAFLGHQDEDVKALRQALLSATVENKTKGDYLRQAYRELHHEKRFNAALEAFSSQKALHEVLDILYHLRDQNKLNNPNIPSMIENYFTEMCLVVFELARVVSPDAKVVMINDNVQYQGQEIPVDLILTDFAKSAGLNLESIWVLSRGKGNSSQQMGVHGRNELRKCVYVWSKPRS